MNVNQLVQRASLSRPLSEKEIEGEFVKVEGEDYYRISNVHRMPEFFMSLTTASDHWMFLSSFGALTAGRRNPDHALFPYYTADKIADLSDSTGCKTVIQLSAKNGTENWIPFSRARSPEILRNVYKTPLGNRVIFEEVHPRLQLSFRYQWSLSHEYGFVRKCQLTNFGSDRTVRLLDGFENILPSGLTQRFQQQFSNLADAYKKNELLLESQLGLYYLSSIPTDRAEPNEGLLSTIVWQSGLANTEVLLCNRQVESFLRGHAVATETDTRGQRGCYLHVGELNLTNGSTKVWQMVADIDHDQTDVINLNQSLLHQSVNEEEVGRSVKQNRDKLDRIVASSDGLQVGHNVKRNSRHLANTLFNVMRGGIPCDGYRVDLEDFHRFLVELNPELAERFLTLGLSNQSVIQRSEFLAMIEEDGCSDLTRASLEYLPFHFGRRHGDPTRPWNWFDISTVDAAGNPVLDYQGNWRDIFQNWEALARSYPEFTESMVFRFVNASSADGYNPYRVTRVGFEWETPDPEDAWSNIGYWGDHQIIYLLKLLEWSRDSRPGQLDRRLAQPLFRYANVPYRIRPYRDMLQDPQDTIEFDFELADQIRERVQHKGSDGKLVHVGEDPHRVNLVEKLLLNVLTKMSNFVPHGGIWLNTQRPEWNDANNALVGRGLSVVTTCYLRRLLAFLVQWFEQLDDESYFVSKEVAQFFIRMNQVVAGEQVEGHGQDAAFRFRIVEQLSTIGSDYRQALYSRGFCGQYKSVSRSELIGFYKRCLVWIDDTIANNRKDDGLYHSYNLMHVSSSDSGVTTVEIEHLPEMLEGQVAVISSGLLDAKAVVELLDQLRRSNLYRSDQNSYMLYPNRRLKRFVEKNELDPDFAERCGLVKALLEMNDQRVVRRDRLGRIHFHGEIRNAECLNQVLNTIEDETLKPLVERDREQLVDHFIEIFDHHRFTGRSSTFFAYEGLGSIYWHMVSKLYLAVNEIYLAGARSETDLQWMDRLIDHSRSIRAGIFDEKTPEAFGAFPMDPYSHTPLHAGAQQPGMTGQVKEDILSRQIELGVQVRHGILHFDPQLFEVSELTQHEDTFRYVDVVGETQEIYLPEGSFAFSICQVPVIYSRAEHASISITMADGQCVTRDGWSLTQDETRQVFSRSGQIRALKIEIPFEEGETP